MATVSAEAVLLDSPPSTSPQPAAAPQESITTTVSVRELDATEKLARHVLLYSFIAAVLLAIGGFVVVTVYLFQYLNHSFASFDIRYMKELAGLESGRMQTILLARAGLWKFILQSCGIIAGVAFGFLGFGLFLLGAKGDMDASFDDSQHKVQLSRMAPGSFVILMAAALIGLCALHRVELRFDPVTTTLTGTGDNGVQTSGSGSLNAPGGANTPAASNDPSVNPSASFFDGSAAPARQHAPAARAAHK